MSIIETGGDETAPLMHPNPSCWWHDTGRNRVHERRARIFHRDKAGELVFEIIGYSSEVDRIAKLIAAGALSNHQPTQRQGAGK